MFHENLTKSYLQATKDPKIYFPAQTEYPKKMAHPIPQYMGVTSFPIQPGNAVWEKFGKHKLVYCSTILCLIFNFANDLLMVYSKTSI